ncbi:ferrochelatase HemH [Methyloglobulus morosus KoM1]|uniref:Ferrochelatase n=1 Tax=Methyloglobulus morosus KoM1 TaxID=1116472 RepID=V5C8V2_9GAMM|nr:ferrochelatase [Methyloglobulus morosus]ESS73153.1 ferrochelatase HemH [Methyloglobulus morosus KoM1]
MAAKKTGILLANLGSPTAPTIPAVRKFLKDFLWDPRVVNIPRPIWWLVLHGFVLPFRPARSAKAYQKIWTDKGSPLIYLTRQLSERLAEKLQDDDISIKYSMRYGEPSIAGQLKLFKEEGVNQIIVLPLYPQYSSTTTASIYDDVVKELNQWRHLPNLQFISDYHQHDTYIDAIADTVKSSWTEHGKNELLLMSFHGLPELLTKLGDPYYRQCQDTARLIAEKLGLNEKQWLLVFQSRFGKAEWLKPYCADTLQKLPGEGIKTVDVICPGFAVDCLETLEEMAMENKAVFIDAGGTDYRYIPALNDSGNHVDAIVNLLDKWI